MGALGYSGVSQGSCMWVENHGGSGFWKRLLFISRLTKIEK